MHFPPIPHLLKQKSVLNQTETVENCALLCLKRFSDVRVCEVNAPFLSTDYPWCVSTSTLDYPEAHNLLRIHA